MDGLLDFIQGASKGFWAGNLGAPVDMATLAVNGLIAGGGYAGHKIGLLESPPPLIERPVGGSEWIAEKMRGVGLLQDNIGSTTDAYGQFAGGLLGPLVATKSPQIAKGLLQAVDNLAAPTQLNKQAGVIRIVANTPKKGLPTDLLQQRLPPRLSPLPDSQKYDKFGGVFDDMNLRIARTSDGDFLSQYETPWGGKVRPFYAKGDNIDELIDYGLSRIRRSSTATDAISRNRYKNTLLGHLESAGLDANDFQLKNSARSSSEYLTHIPSGTKIRVSDHDLPLGYVQPDVDLRQSQSTAEQAAQVLKYLGL